MLTLFKKFNFPVKITKHLHRYLTHKELYEMYANDYTYNWKLE